jgi:hypothetical protein
MKAARSSVVMTASAGRVEEQALADHHRQHESLGLVFEGAHPSVVAELAHHAEFLVL